MLFLSLFCCRADCSKADVAGNTAEHNGLTQFGRVSNTKFRWQLQWFLCLTFHSMTEKGFFETFGQYCCTMDIKPYLKSTLNLILKICLIFRQSLGPQTAAKTREILHSGYLPLFSSVFKAFRQWPVGLEAVERLHTDYYSVETFKFELLAIFFSYDIVVSVKRFVLISVLRWQTALA